MAAPSPSIALNGQPLIPPTQDLDDVEGEHDALFTPYLRRMALVAGLGGLLFGYDTGIISSVLVTIKSDLNDELLTTGQEEVVVSATTIGALFGAGLAGQLADRIGRKKTLLAGSVFFALGAVEQSAAQVYKELVLGRGMVGIGVGLASMVLPMYCSELSPAKFRGQMVTLLVVLVTFGQVVAYLIGAIFAPLSSGWRWMVLSGAVPAVVQLVLSIALPESPRYLIQKDKLHAAHLVLSRIYSHLDDDAVQRKVASIERILVVEQEAIVQVHFPTLTGSSGRHAKGRSLTDALWHDLPNRRALVLACGLQFFQQATGFNTLMYYSGKILQSAGFSHPASAAIFIAMSNFVCTVISLRLIDRVGRRPMLLRTLLGMIGGLFMMGFCFLFIRLPTEELYSETVMMQGHAASYAALLSMVLFCASYGLGLGNVPWIVQAEIFSYEVRSVGSSCATAVNWTANLLVASTFLHLTKFLTPTGTYWLYLLITTGAWIFTWHLLPETRGLTIEQSRKLFESPSPGIRHAPSSHKDVLSRIVAEREAEAEYVTDGPVAW